MRNKKVIDLVLILLTYVVVKVVKKVIGFNYNPFKEGIMTVNFLVDVAIWGTVYAILYFLFKIIRAKTGWGAERGEHV
ncbi:hypothetical protein ACD591_20460 [Rufibacter glacialis]|uniref:Uncharacterized protein n=1 Tax=Rufibacter glacialis TaxID=1259555 RepID=A0A5M8QBS0_9BACT|nr:hypothetical protein [Rufibacter glacialis]KAA6432266.1 hypothetical protein FOE74_14230 [Rufibacter glacialis]GGK77262.1 hypothetical protein GCM10011405_26310 [Rufibacter glacialis]